MSFWNRGFWAPLFGITLIWALGATFQVWVMKRAQVKPAASSEDSSASDLELRDQMVFAQRFAPLLLGYSEADFVSRQNEAASLLSENLREKRLSELAERTSRRAEEKFGQRMTVESITFEKGHFLVRGDLDGEQDGSKWNFDYTLKLRVGPKGAGSEGNSTPWEVSFFELETRPQTDPSMSSLVSVREGVRLELIFPCLVRNVDSGLGEDLALKISPSDKRSAVEFLRKTPWERTISARVNCRDHYFQIDFVPALPGDALDLYRLWPASLAREDEAKVLSRKKLSPYKNTLEKQLDFIIEE